MKIALVILHTDPMRGGAERYTMDLATALGRRGHDVSLLHSALLAQDFSVTQQIGEPFQRVKLMATGLTRTSRYRRLLKSMDIYLEESTFDVVHAMLPVNQCHVYHPHAGLASAAVAGAKLKAAMNPRRLAMAEVERRLLTLATPPLVLCLSDYVKRAVRRNYPLDDSHLPTLFNAVDIERFDPEKRPDTMSAGRITALMIAQDFDRKGLHPAIAALAQVPEPRLILRVVGKDKSAPYERLAASLGVGDRVQFAGPTDDPASEYARADFFVLPTRHDPCSLVVLEALAMGLPVISTAFNGACEIMTHGTHGFVLPDPADVSALAHAMTALLDRDLRSRMSSACLALRPRLSYEHHLDRLIQIYEQVAVQSNRIPPASC